MAHSTCYKRDRIAHLKSKSKGAASKSAKPEGSAMAALILKGGPYAAVPSNNTSGCAYSSSKYEKHYF